jgi:hypothetical protein
VNPIHQIADGRLRLLAAVVKVTGIPEASIIGRGRLSEVVSARRIIDFALVSLGWSQSEIADVVYGVESHCGVSYRMERPLNDIERANMNAAMTLAESRPSTPSPRQPVESMQKYIVRLVAYTLSLDAAEVFSDNQSARALDARAIAAWLMHGMGMPHSEIARSVGDRQWHNTSCRHWRRRVDSPRLMPTAERLLEELRKQTKEAA